MKKLLFCLIMFFTFVFSNSLGALTIDTKKDQVYLGGETVGLKIDTGVMVAKTFAINDGMHLIKPWDDANLRENDIIISYNNYNIKTSDDLLNALKKSGMQKSEMIIQRNNKNIKTHITPYLKDDAYSLGIYVKDNITGVGTMTYIIPQNQVFGALGHQIDRTNSNSGKLLEAKVVGINRGEVGHAGSKKAEVSTKELGSIAKNTITGIHGYYNGHLNHQLIAIAKRDVVHEGEAYLVTAVDNNVKKYQIEIISVKKQNKKDIKGIKFKVTDSELIQASGGIIQGMSGSPIVQDGKLVGAVTHVLVNNPQEGYGIFIEFMLEDMGIDVI